MDKHDIQIHYNFVTFFWVLASGHPTVTSGILQLSFALLAQTCSYATDCLPAFNTRMRQNALGYYRRNLKWARKGSLPWYCSQ